MYIVAFCHEYPIVSKVRILDSYQSSKQDDGLNILHGADLCFSSISPEGSPSRQGISETEFMERIRERMAQEVGGYVSMLAMCCAHTGKREETGFFKSS